MNWLNERATPSEIALLVVVVLYAALRYFTSY